MAKGPRVITKALRPRARLLVLLGDQLIRDANMAVFEMVKNAYDADATTCTIELRNVAEGDPPDASIAVSDNGTGMTIDTVVNQWLEPGTDTRRLQKDAGKRSRLGRLPLGEKGLGRFAAHKLGRKIQVITRSKDSREVVVEIDWDRFDPPRHSDKDNPLYLDEIPIEVRERDPELFTGRKTGTQITVSELREMPWTRRSVRSLHRSVTSLSAPIEDDTSFDARLTVAPDRGWLQGLLTVDKVLEHAPFRFVGVLSGTTLSYSYEFKPGAKLERRRVTSRKRVVKSFPIIRDPHPDEKADAVIPVEQLEDLPADAKKKGVRVDLDKVGLGPIGVNLHIYDLDTQVIELTLGDPRSLRNYLDDNGGVRVYRDGIRVFDFGEPGNDWLDLEGRRVNAPSGKIGNNQVIGSVFLGTEKSRQLVEKTNREGFVENNAYFALRDAVACAVAQAAAERNEDKLRLRKALHVSKDKTPVIDELQEVRQRLRDRKIEQEFDDVLRRIEFEHQKFRDTMLLAAGTGLNLAAIIHQIEKDIKYLVLLVKRPDSKEQISEVVERLGRMTDTMAWLLSDAPSGIVQASQLIRQAMNTWRFRFEHHNIKATSGFDLDDPCPDFQRKMSRKLVSTALMNLLDNAIYWVGTQAENRRIFVGTTNDLGKGPAIVVADNGPGLQGEAPEALVQPFFTRKPGGTGLGLHIANEIMKQHHGHIEFPGRGEVELPRGFGGACVALVWED